MVLKTSWNANQPEQDKDMSKIIWYLFQALNIVTHEEDVYDVITGLKQKTFYGRPNWDDVFANVASENAG